MMDPTTLSALAATVVAALVPYFTKALEKGAEEIGKSSVGALVDKFKKSLSRDHTEEARQALDELAKEPQDQDLMAALRVQLKKSMQAHPDLEPEWRAWLDEVQRSGLEPTSGQSAVVGGVGNQVVQIGTGANHNSIQTSIQM